MDSQAAAAFGRRLRERAHSKNLTAADLARVAAVPKQSMSGYWSGATLPKSDRLFSLSDALDVDARWLVEGEGSPSGADFVEVQEIDLAYGLGGTFPDEHVDVLTHRFPRTWIEAITLTPPALLTFARGRGDSMMPTINDGDMVLIDRSQRTIREQDALWALTIGEIAMIKRIRARGERVTILSDNDRVPPDEAHHEEINVVGRVIFVGSKK